MEYILSGILVVLFVLLILGLWQLKSDKYIKSLDSGDCTTIVYKGNSQYVHSAYAILSMCILLAILLLIMPLTSFGFIDNSVFITLVLATFLTCFLIVHFVLKVKCDSCNRSLYFSEEKRDSNFKNIMISIFRAKEFNCYNCGQHYSQEVDAK
ncbi:hypothetical protein [Photobacterium lutimaris]|uniref:Uncharacterized protein n=1 Tax=Photobacterium lutimaris TaxID=388278 RepID=A0A2T3J0J8_9GAMM|nr:hypothetical protein [Photobacterium lutimaris]PSU34614.1 hypothetical protein C9I99_05815 [Photobacterium lutimaris]TDR71543.1 hypothetical protein DFP78_11677 [Photobacterium lutimaris]